MAINSEQDGKLTGEDGKKRRHPVLWMGVIGIVFVIVLGILLQNSKALEIGGIGILVLLLLLRVVLHK